MMTLLALQTVEKVDNLQTKSESNVRAHVPPNQYNTDVYNRCVFSKFLISPAEGIQYVCHTWRTRP